MKKSVLMIGIIFILVSTSFISSATSVTNFNKINESKTLPTDRYVKYFFGPVYVSTSEDFLSKTTFITKSFIIKDTATSVFAWDIVSGKMYLDTPQGSVKLGPGSSFIADTTTLSYTGIELTDLPVIIKIISLCFHITNIDLTGLNGQAFGVKVYSTEPI